MARGQALEQVYSLDIDFSNVKIDYPRASNLT